MPKRMPILPSADLADEYAIKIWIAPAVIDGQLTRNQWRALVEFLAPRAPLHVYGLSCRTPKGVIYLFIDRADGRIQTYRLSPRAEWYTQGLTDLEWNARQAAGLPLPRR